ncbi:MAG: glycosyltransferase [Acidobacteria bacterium]|nr:glycosyltransferase [Acidobacteriota bacterium]
MSGKADLSVVISSFNRDDTIRETLEYLFRSDTRLFGEIELLIIDDGSPRPVRDVLAKAGNAPSPFRLRLIEQTNAGIGATRNRGFREAKYELALFLDDDILVKPETLSRFLDAHRTYTAGVIFGSYPFRSHSSRIMEKFANRLYGYDRSTTKPCYDKVDAITSGLLFIDKKRLGDQETFYRDDLSIPAAEEHEVIYRFHKLGIPIYHALHISATHNHHLELDWLVEQQYKYGLAMAEAFDKVPELVEMERYAGLREELRFAGVKGLIKRCSASIVGRTLLLQLARLSETVFSDGNNIRLIGLTTTAYFWAGYLHWESESPTNAQ